MTVEGEVRVGDTERRQVDALLQRATGDGMLTLLEYEERSGRVWAARTRAELADVTRDLPTGPGFQPPQPTVRTTGYAGGSRRGKPRWGVAIMSETRIGDDVLPGQPLHAIAVMGHAVVDLRRDSLPPETFVSATAVMGQVEVLVPNGVRVESNGISIMGGREIRIAPPTGPDAPLIRVHATAVMGSVEIKSPKSGRIAQLKESYGKYAGDRAARRAAHVERHAERAMTHAERHAVRHQHRRRGPLLAIATGVVLVTGAGAVAASVNGDNVGGFGDRTVPVSQGQSYKIGQFFGDVKIEAPQGSCVDFSGTHWFGDTHGPAQCGAPGTNGEKAIKVRVDGAFGDVQAEPTS